VTKTDRHLAVVVPSLTNVGCGTGSGDPPCEFVRISRGNGVSNLACVSLRGRTGSSPGSPGLSGHRPVPDRCIYRLPSQRMTSLTVRDMLSWTNAAGSMPASRDLGIKNMAKNPPRSMCGLGGRR